MVCLPACCSGTTQHTIPHEQSEGPVLSIKAVPPAAAGMLSAQLLQSSRAIPCTRLSCRQQLQPVQGLTLV